MQKILIQTDGASRGNPGPAAYGFVIYLNGELYKKEGKTIGIATNNIAEYTGLLKALEFMEERRVDFVDVGELEVQADSQLMIRQLSGQYKIKNARLKVIFDQINQLLDRYQAVHFTHIRREFNKEADLLGNLALDGKI